MEIIKINPHKPQSNVIEKAVEELRRGNVIVYPTDTCYGLGADMTNIFAIEKIYRIKGRESHNKPFSMIIKDIEQLEKYALIDTQMREIINKNLPGPFTFIMLNLDYKNFKQPSIGIRIPDYPITLHLANRFHKPFATTSANITGAKPSYSVSELLKQMSHNQYLPDLILDAGTLPQNLPSTVVDLSDHKPRILRQGSGKLIL